MQRAALTLVCASRALLIAISQISQLCSKLQLPKIVTDSASEIYKNACAQPPRRTCSLRFSPPSAPPADKKAIRGRSKPAVLGACIYIGCRREAIERSFSEICGAAEGTNVKEMGRVYQSIIKVLDEVAKDMGSRAVQDEKICVRMCASMGLPPELGRAGKAIAAAARRLMETETTGLDATTRKTPMTIAAAAMWLAINLHGGVGRSLADVSVASSMVEDTIGTAARWLFPHVRELVDGCASAFRREEAIRRIEQAHPLRVSASQRLGTLIASCVAAKELMPPTQPGLTDKQKEMVTSAAQSIGVQLQQADWLAARGLAPQPLNRALAAACVWLALQLVGMRQVSSLNVCAAGGIASPPEMRAAAQLIFPHARALAAACASPLFRSDETLLRIEGEHPRLLWLGDAPSLAVQIVAAVLAPGGDIPPPPAAFVNAIAHAAAAEVGDARIQEAPAYGRTAAIAAASAALALRLAGWRSGGGTGGAGAVVLYGAGAAGGEWGQTEVAAAAHVDVMALLGAALLIFPNARQMGEHAAAASAFAVDAAGLAAVEADFPPPVPVAAPQGGEAQAPAQAAGGDSF